MKHLHGHESHLRPCVHFITFGLNHGPVQIRFPTILSLDLSKHLPPPEHLCSRFNGLHPIIVHSFFSIEANEAEFHRALAELRGTVKAMPQGGCVAYAINCTAGRHRSVAMAERLKDEVRHRYGYKAECLHLDLMKGGDVRDENLARVDAWERLEDMPERGRRRSRYEEPARSEARVRENGPRGAATTTTDARLPTRR